MSRLNQNANWSYVTQTNKFFPQKKKKITKQFYKKKSPDKKKIKNN